MPEEGVFCHSRHRAVLLMASGTRKKSESALVTFGEVAEVDFAAFLHGSTLTRSDAVRKTQEEAEEGLAITRLHQVWERLRSSPTLKQIAENAGTSGSVVVRRVMESKDNEGYNALTGEFVDVVKAGIITPTKVERTALQNASEVAILLLTTDCIIVEKPKEKEEGGGHGHDHGMGGMGGMGGMDDMM